MSGREKPLILQNGVPIPQAYDKDLGDWTEYSTEHIKAIKAELALVKAELQAIKANQLSGDQKVTLSGTNVELETLTNATTVPPKDYVTLDIPGGSEKTLYIFVNIDREPWYIAAGNIVSPHVRRRETIAPYKMSRSEAFPLTSDPIRLIFMGLDVSGELKEETDLFKLTKYAYPTTGKNISLRLGNDSEDNATVTIRILRDFRR